MSSDIPNTTELAAAVNAPELVPLFAPDGEAIHVLAAKVDAWLARGFTRLPVDLDTLYSNLAAHVGALAAPWRDYVGACREAGHLDAAAQDTAHEALRLVGEAANQLHLAIHRSFKSPE